MQKQGAKDLSVLVALERLCNCTYCSRWSLVATMRDAAPVTLTQSAFERQRAGYSPLVWAALLVVYVVWGSTYLAMREVVHYVPPFLMAGTRFVLMGAVLFGILALRGEPLPTRQGWVASAPVGVLMFVMGNGTVALAEKSIDSGVAAVVCGTMPLCMSAMRLLFGERTTRREWTAMLLGLLGVASLYFGKHLTFHITASLLLMLAPLSWALGSILTRRLPLPLGLMAAATQMVTGGVVGLMVSLALREGLPPYIPTSALLSWLYLCIFGSLLAFSAYTYLLRNARPALAVSYAYVNPPVALALGVAFGHEQAGPEVFVATLLVVLATVLVVGQKDTVK
jgi:drug/metabolite transporter (DMT)-like permease